jgi:hypothetical protein
MSISEKRKPVCSHVQGEPHDTRYYQPERQKECDKPAEFEARVKLEDNSFVWAPICKIHAKKFDEEDIRTLVSKESME